MVYKIIGAMVALEDLWKDYCSPRICMVDYGFII